MTDMAARWAAAKLGPASVRDGKRMCVVHVECPEGDPRAEVCALIEGAAKKWTRVEPYTGTAPPDGAKGEWRAVDPEADTQPKRKRAKKGSE